MYRQLPNVYLHPGSSLKGYACLVRRSQAHQYTISSKKTFVDLCHFNSLKDYQLLGCSYQGLPRQVCSSKDYQSPSCRSKRCLCRVNNFKDYQFYGSIPKDCLCRVSNSKDYLFSGRSSKGWLPVTFLTVRILTRLHVTVRKFGFYR